MPAMLRRSCVAYTLLGLALWPIPLLNVLQVESAAVVALGSYFIAGWASTSLFRQDDASFFGVLARQEGALVVPLLMLLVAQIWAPNCTLGQGLLFYGLFPGITVAFSVALGYFFTGLSTRSPFAVHAGTGVAIVMVGPIYDLGLHPQLYSYNHVFGGILGPIYDEQLAVRRGLFAFRGLTLLWTGAAVAGGRLLRGHEQWTALLLCLAGLVGGYANADWLGINTSAATLQAALEGHYQTSHFDIYYDPERADSLEIRALADDHEASYAFIRNKLRPSGESLSGRIQSYIYPNPDVKGRLTGARRTSVSPVWLGEPQIHVLERRAQASVDHEVAHVMARPYGIPLLRASWAPGLVEGWAVALEGPDSAPSSHDLMSVDLASASVNRGRADAEDVVQRLSPWGFWTGRGEVSYAAMGSFVDYLLQTYGPDRLKRVYPWADFESVYGRSLRTLAREWEDFLRTRPVVSTAARDVVSRRFTQPSLFETKCPHHVPASRRHVQQARRFVRNRDTVTAKRRLRSALKIAPQYQPAHEVLSTLRLAQGQATVVRQQLDTLDLAHQSAQLHLRQGDAHALTGAPASARSHYGEAYRKTPRFNHERRGRLILRDAVAHRTDIVRILTSGDSAHVQARRLDAYAEEPAVTAWQALRWTDAHRYEQATEEWIGTSQLSAGRSRAWFRTWSVQRRAWAAEAATRAGDSFRARQWAAEAARRAERLGADEWAATLRRWEERAASQTGTGVHSVLSRGRSAAN